MVTSVTNENETIIKTYNKIHKFVFKHSVFLITTLFSFIIVRSAVSPNTAQTTSQSIDITLLSKEKELVLRFEKLLSQSIDNTDIKIQIIQGYLNNTGDYIDSTNNLITYKGYVIPRFFSIYKTLPLPQISYFANHNYDINELNNFIQNIIAIKKEDSKRQNQSPKLPLINGVIDTFDLSCLSRSRIFQTICDIRIQRFIQGFFVYDLSMDYEGFSQVFTTLTSNPNLKEKMCDNLHKYITYSNDTNIKIEELFNVCGGKYLETFQTLKGFIQIQSQLTNKQISSTTYNNKDLNAYKLLSTQQRLYEEIVTNRISTTAIGQYFSFLKEILTNKIENFYKDLSFYFDNVYIKPRLENASNQTNNKIEINGLIKEMNDINNGNESLGIIGLTAQITNPNLLLKTGVTQEGSGVITTQQDQAMRLLENISYLKIKNKAFSGDDILINSDIILNKAKALDKNRLKLDTTILITYQNSTFWVKKIKISNQDTVNAILKEILSKNPYTLNQIDDYIESNIALYDQTYQIDASNLLCEQIKNRLKQSNTSDITCGTNSITISKVNGNQPVIYTISFTDYKITDISISDKNLEQIIKEKMQNIQTNELNFIDIIDGILAFGTKITTVQSQLSAGALSHILIVSEEIKSYLGIKVTDIAEKNNKILIDFNVGGISFIGYYILGKHLIYPIYFKTILVNALPARIMNFSLALDDTNKSNIYKFISNPLEYIQIISPEGYLLYKNTKK